jgi:hypothetical protein
MFVPTRASGLEDVRAAADRARDAELQIAARARGPLEVWNPIQAAGVGDGRFKNGFVNESSGVYHPCGYMKDHMGFVHLRGRFVKDNFGVPINAMVMFTLPPNWRPDQPEAFWSTFLYVVSVQVNGDVYLHTGTTFAEGALDPCAFKAAG